MQLIIVSLTLFFLVWSTQVKAQLKKLNLFQRQQVQSKDSTEILVDAYEAMEWKTIDVNFLSSYYVQDGNNAAVTGGIGDEHLTDFTQKVILKVPLTKKLTVNADAGYDYYSSASTDNIDNIQSSASSVDVRTHGNLGIEYKIDQQHSFAIRGGGSNEYDYISASGGLSYSYLSKDQNSQFNASVQAFIDQWSLFRPSELRGEADPNQNPNRNSFNAAMDFSQIVNKKLQVSFMLEAIYMNGLLSTPFHRVYFRDQERAKIENLPSSRLKIPLATRVNAYINEWMIARAYYRYYWDDWGLTGHTASLELPIKLNRFLSVYPFYRYHQQTAADYFAPYKEHLTSDEFYTSDYDLSALTSHAFGLGISYAPVNGILNIKTPFSAKRKLSFNSIDLKYSHYQRSTGLNANIICLGLGFKF